MKIVIDIRQEGNGSFFKRWGKDARWLVRQEFDYGTEKIPQDAAMVIEKHLRLMFEELAVSDLRRAMCAFERAHKELQ